MTEPERPSPRRAGETEQAALLRAMRAHGPPLLRYVLRLTSGDRQFAEDVVQESMLRLAQAKSSSSPANRYGRGCSP